MTMSCLERMRSFARAAACGGGAAAGGAGGAETRRRPCHTPALHDFSFHRAQRFVEEVLELVELAPLRNALVGLPGVSGLSVEQRKRLTIAVELVANPSIIFLDEPTSGAPAAGAGITALWGVSSVVWGARLQGIAQQGPRVPEVLVAKTPAPSKVGQAYALFTKELGGTRHVSVSCEGVQGTEQMPCKCHSIRMKPTMH